MDGSPLQRAVKAANGDVFDPSVEESFRDQREVIRSALEGESTFSRQIRPR
jgi:hypothetical protein